MHFLFCSSIIFSAFVIIVSSKLEGPCNTPNGDRGQCISIYNCKNLLDLLSNLNSEKVRFLKKSQCGYDSVPYVCCSSTNNNVNNTSGFDKTINPLLLLGDCGDNQPTRFSGGGQAQLLEFPWLALLQYEKNHRKSISCAGVLINNKYVLTAAHCVTGSITERAGPLVSVRLGEYDLSENPDCLTFGTYKECIPPLVDIKVNSILVHPKYNNSSLNRYHDIALVRLEQEVEYEDNVKPVCLPIPLKKEIPQNKNSLYYTIVGWGFDEYGNFSSSRKLKTVMPSVAENQCNAILEKTGMSVIESQICIGTNKTNFAECHADSGGPLMYLTENGWYMKGVLSFRTSCLSDDWIGVYTKVLSYFKWIHSNVLP